MTNKKYTYFYPENKALGEQLSGTAGFIVTMLKGKYSRCYVNMVMQGTRTNKEIEACMLHLIEVSKTYNY